MKILWFLILSIPLFAQNQLLIFDSGITYGDIPNYEAVGAIAQGTTSVDVPYPSGIAANDILIMQINLSDAESVFDITTPTGWALGGEEEIGTYQLQWYWKRAIGDETGNLTVTTAGMEDSKGRISRYSGCITSGTPYEAATSTGFVSTNDSAYTQEITTLAPNRLAVCLINVLDDITVGDMTTYTENFDDNLLTGSPDATMAGESLDVANAGTVAVDAAVLSGTDAHSTFTFALKPTE